MRQLESWLRALPKLGLRNNRRHEKLRSRRGRKKPLFGHNVEHMNTSFNSCSVRVEYVIKATLLARNLDQAASAANLQHSLATLEAVARNVF